MGGLPPLIIIIAIIIIAIIIITAAFAIFQASSFAYLERASFFKLGVASCLFTKLPTPVSNQMTAV